MEGKRREGKRLLLIGVVAALLLAGCGTEGGSAAAGQDSAAEAAAGQEAAGKADQVLAEAGQTDTGRGAGHCGGLPGSTGDL